MAATSLVNLLSESGAADLPKLVEELAHARSNADQTRIAARGLQRLLHAKVSVSAGGTFRPELRQLVGSAVLVPSTHHRETTSVREPRLTAGPTRSLLISAGPRHRVPRYLLWRPEPFDAGDIRTAEGMALMVIALHLRWESDAGAPRRSVDQPKTPEPSALGLTGRETIILEHLARGLSAEGIAAATGISPRTVRKHLQHVYAKLGAHDRLVAVEAARAAGLLRSGRSDLVSR